MIETRKYLSVFIFIFVLQLGQVLWARPITKIDLSYDEEEKVLHIEAKHITRDQRDDYVRILYVYKNEEAPVKFTYVKQTNPTKLIQDVSLEAVSGDEIRVKAICNDADRNEETLIIP